MIAVVHILAGATIGALLDQPALIVVIAFFLHYLMDFLPHLDAETFAVRRLPYSWNQYITLAVDSITALIISGLLFFLHKHWANVVLGLSASLLPDLLIPLERYNAFWPLRRMHNLFHWNRRRAQQWHWYIASIVTPTLFAVVSSAILWASL